MVHLVTIIHSVLSKVCVVSADLPAAIVTLNLNVCIPTGRAALMPQSSHGETHPRMSADSCSTKTETKPEPPHG